jgi:hypothetical protein
MAMENRFSRRILGEAVQDAIYRAMKLKQDRYVRIILPGRGTDLKAACIILVLAHPFHSEAESKVKLSYEEYRKIRAMVLEGYCLAVLHTHRSMNMVVGIGMDVDSSQSEIGSVDFYTMQIDEWTPELEAEALEAIKDLDLLREDRMGITKSSVNEFPIRDEKGHGPMLINFRSSRSGRKKRKK